MVGYMPLPEKISRCGFVVTKLLIDSKPFFLMRFNRKWHDIAFIGGHEMERDANKLSRVAYRELLEEVPSFRPLGDIELEPITDQFCYGPVFSESAKVQVGYELQFFLLKFFSSPEKAIGQLGPRSANVLLSQEVLRDAHTYKIASLVDLLDDVYPGGLAAIPFSWNKNLSLHSLRHRDPQLQQLHLHLDHQ